MGKGIFETMTTALGYIRRSSKKSDARTVSLDSQREAIRAYCQRQGFDLIDVLAHDGISGTKRHRFGALDKAVKEFRPSRLVVYHLDRLARDQAGLIDYLKSLTKRGVEVHETTKGPVKFDPRNDPDSAMTIGILAAVDEAYAWKIGLKTRDALGKLKRNLKRYSRVPPLGFKFEYDFTDIDGHKHFKLIQEPEEQRALHILAKCKADGLGARRALKILSDPVNCYTGRQSLTVIHKALRREVL